MRDRTISISSYYRTRTDTNQREYTPNSSYEFQENDLSIPSLREPSPDTSFQNFNFQESNQLTPIETLGNIAVNFNNPNYLQLSSCCNSFVFLTFISIWQVFLGTFLVFHSLLIIPGFQEKHFTIGFTALFLGIAFFFSGTNGMQSLGQESRLNKRLYPLSICLITRGCIIFFIALVVSTDIKLYINFIQNWNTKVCTSLEFPTIPLTSLRVVVISYPLVMICMFCFSVFDVYCGLIAYFHLQWVRNEQERIRNRRIDIVQQILA